MEEAGAHAVQLHVRSNVQQQHAVTKSDWRGLLVVGLVEKGMILRCDMYVIFVVWHVMCVLVSV
jgi:hypothetical protein